MSYETAAIAYVGTMLARCGAWQTLTGSATEAAARSRIVGVWGGDQGHHDQPDRAEAIDGQTFTTVPPWALIERPQLDRTLSGVSHWDVAGTIVVRLVMARLLAAETPSAAVTRLEGVAGDIRAQLEAQFGTSGALATGAVQLDAADFAPREQDRLTEVEFLLTITFEG